MLADLAFARFTADPQMLHAERCEALRNIKPIRRPSAMLPMSKMPSQIREQLKRGDDFICDGIALLLNWKSYSYVTSSHHVGKGRCVTLTHAHVATIEDT